MLIFYAPENCRQSAVRTLDPAEHGTRRFLWTSTRHCSDVPRCLRRGRRLSMVGKQGRVPCACVSNPFEHIHDSLTALLGSLIRPDGVSA